MPTPERHVRPVVGAAAFGVATFCIGWGAHGLLRPPPTPPLLFAPAPPPAPSSSVHVPEEEVFTDIYRSAKWGKNGGDAGTSGFGSTVHATVVYHAFLQQFMKDHDIHSVVDAGCGDWESTQSVDWSGVDYKGYDIVESVIENDKKKFGKPNVQFFHANIVDADLPPADLLLCKQVLQHLPTAEVQKFLTKLGNYKHVLLMDTVDAATLSGPNYDIVPGQFRALDLTRPPFNVAGTKVLTYWDGGSMEQVIHIKRP